MRVEVGYLREDLFGRWGGGGGGGQGGGGAAGVDVDYGEEEVEGAGEVGVGDVFPLLLDEGYHVLRLAGL